MNFLYGDGSQDKDQKYFVAAAYLGNESQWTSAVQTWSSILADARVGYFHATDFFSGRKLWKGYRPQTPEHTALIDRFTVVARDAGLIGFAFGVEVESFNRIMLPALVKETRQHSIRDLRTYAIMTVVKSVSDFLAECNNVPLASIHIGFEAEQGDDKWRNFFDEAKAHRVDFTRWFYDFRPEPKELVPVQIADLLAFETRNRGVRLQTVHDARLRYEFERMVQRKQIMLTWMLPDDMNRHAEKIRETLEQYPDGILPLDKVPQYPGPSHPWLKEPVWFNSLPREEQDRLLRRAGVIDEDGK